MTKVEIIALLQRLRKRASMTTDEMLRDDLTTAVMAIEDAQKWFGGNFNILRYPWWAKAYWLSVSLTSLAVGHLFGLPESLFAFAAGSLLAVVAYGLYIWIRWCNGWD